MLSVQVEKVFCIILYTLLVASCLQLASITWAKPLPVTEEAAVNETACYCNCNDTNLTMMVDGNFLHKWLKFNAHHSIRHLSEAAGNLAANTNDLQTKSCYNDYSNYFNLIYHQSQPVTHALLRQFYNGFILHRRFIQEKLLVLWINRHLRKQLTAVKTELNQNIARLYHVLNISGCDCVPDDCEQTTNVLQQLTQSTEHCFADFNYPINDVARKILNDANYLHTIIEQLHEQNPQNQTNVEAKYSFDLKIIENIMKVESKWCHYTE